MKKKRMSFLLVAILLVVGLTGCAGNEAQNSGQDTETEQTETVRVAVMTNNITQWVATVGETQGIFAENGIDLEVSEFAAGINTADAVALGQAEIGNMADYALVNRIGSVENSTLRILASTQVTKDGTAGTSLYVNPDQIKALSDLAGQPLGTVIGTVNDYYVDQTYTVAGISEVEQNIVAVSDFAAGVTAAQTGDIVALWASGADAQKVQTAGFVALISLADLQIFTNAYVFTTETYLADHQETIIKYLKAYQATIDWMIANEDQAAKIIEEKNYIPADVFLSSLASQNYRLSLEQSDVDTITELEDWEFLNGNFKQSYDIRSFIKADPLKVALPASVNFH
jgi:NitT/TauT family transport system substrate-binding protein